MQALLVPKSYGSLTRHDGNRDLFAAVEMSVIATSGGVPLHLHVEGARGTGKTSVLRAAREVLPKIERVRGCLYNCDPSEPHCPEHRALSAAAVHEIGTETVPAPFLEISHAAKIGTVSGSLDLQAMTETEGPRVKVLPGTLAQAHRGIVLVDEINRLVETSPELADLLLDAMGTKPGRLQIEESGLPRVCLPLKVSVWAASNPDEDPGPLEEIRRQLSDRFDFAVRMDRPRRAEDVEAILRAVQPAEPRAKFEAGRFAGGLPSAAPDWLYASAAEIYLSHGLESLRAAQAIILGTQASAARFGRAEPTREDLRLVLPLALRHRVEAGVLARIIKSAEENEGSRESIAASLPNAAARPAERAETLDRAFDRNGSRFLNRLSERLRTWAGLLGTDKQTAENPEDANATVSFPRPGNPLRSLGPEEWVKSRKDPIR